MKRHLSASIALLAVAIACAIGWETKEHPAFLLVGFLSSALAYWHAGEVKK